MHKSEVKAVFLAVLLIAGTITIGIHFDDAQASSDRKDQKDKKIEITIKETRKMLEITIKETRKMLEITMIRKIKGNTKKIMITTESHMRCIRELHI